MSLSFIICYWWVVLLATGGGNKRLFKRFCSIVNISIVLKSLENFRWLGTGSTIQQWEVKLPLVPLCARPRVCSLTKQKHIIYDFRICRVVELSSTKVSAGLYILQPPSSLQPGARRRGVPCRDDRTSLKATTPACRAASDLWFTGSVIAVSWLGEEPTATTASTARPSAPEADRLRFDHRSIISSWNVALTPEILAR